MPRAPRQDARVTFQAKIRARREALGLTQAEAAARAGVSLMSWQRFEDPKASPGNSYAKTRRSVSAALGWSPDSIDRLLRGEEALEVLQVQAAYAGRALSPGELADLLREVLDRLDKIDRRLS
jgi:transcriptional regulator with XRE-family HTH domain